MGDPNEVVGDGETGGMSTANSKNPLFLKTWLTDPAWVGPVERGANGKLMPFKAAYFAGAIMAISAIRARFRQFEGHALVLRVGKDPFEGGGTTDLCIAILEASSTDKAASVSFRSYPTSGHDVIFEECAEGLSMAAGKNRVVDDIVAFLNEHAAR